MPIFNMSLFCKSVRMHSHWSEHSKCIYTSLTHSVNIGLIFTVIFNNRFSTVIGHLAGNFLDFKNSFVLWIFVLTTAQNVSKFFCTESKLGVISLLSLQNLGDHGYPQFPFLCRVFMSLKTCPTIHLENLAR